MVETRISLDRNEREKEKTPIQPKTKRSRCTHRPTRTLKRLESERSPEKRGDIRFFSDVIGGNVENIDQKCGL